MRGLVGSALLVALAVAAVSGPAAAQVEAGGALHACRLPVVETAAPAAVGGSARRAAPDCDPATEGARFEVAYTGFPDAARAAFQAAVDTWSCRIRSDQTVRVSATWSSLEAGTLGSAGPYLYRNFDGAPARDVWYPAALADHYARRDLGDGEPDIDAFFNSQFSDWHFGPGPPPARAYDLYTVVLHELGHGLGLIGTMAVEDGLGYVGREPRGPYSYDLHTVDAEGRPLLDATRYPDRSAALADALVSPVRFTGRAVRASGSGPVPLYSPSRWVAGGSYSHLDEDAFAPGTPDGLMTPFIAREETVAAPGTAVCAVLADVGWTLAGDCAARVGPLPPIAGGVRVERRGPNPFSTTTRVSLESDATLSVGAVLVDVLGRRVADYGRRVLVADRPLDLTLDGSRLASGVYTLVVVGAEEAVRVPFTVVR